MTYFSNHQLIKKELLDKGYREYRGKEMNVYFNGEICIHAAECIRGNSAVFNPRQKPWIKVDSASAAEVKNIIDRCPSGALQYESE
ncbi:MAG TPA: (4Fe-4S)-binding protein [Tetragenococcus sp.]|nr:(4Fe-4S)-binding protein [Tetragenococcus sp.]